MTEIRSFAIQKAQPTGYVELDDDMILQRKRRPINKEWLKVFEDIRGRTAKYGDHLLRIDTIEMYEGVDDKPADCIIACNILEDLRRPEKHLDRINFLAKKSAIITIKMDKKRNEEFWKNMIQAHMNLCDWQVTGNFITAVTMPGMRLGGIKPVGALTDDARWEAVLSSIGRIKQRIEPCEAHDRTALLACYGPSLNETYPMLAKAEGDIISVSGSHDFLLERGIVPKFHVECDPRAHKTDNIKVGHRDITYLIASNCHFSYFDKLEGLDIRLWHVAISEHCMKLVDDLHESNKWIVSGGGSVGLRSISLLYAMGYRKFAIYGMDCSFADGGVQQWAGPHAGKRQDLCEAVNGDEKFVTSPVLITYAAGFFDLVKRLPEVTFSIWGNGLLQSMCRSSYKQQEAA